MWALYYPEEHRPSRQKKVGGSHVISQQERLHLHRKHKPRDGHSLHRHGTERNRLGRWDKPIRDLMLDRHPARFDGSSVIELFVYPGLFVPSIPSVPFRAVAIQGHICLTACAGIFSNSLFILVHKPAFSRDVHRDRVREDAHGLILPATGRRTAPFQNITPRMK